MQALSNKSDLVFVWHDNAGQSLPTNLHNIQTKVDTNGFTINIPDNSILTDPIIIISSAGSESIAKNNINIGKHSSVSIVEYVMSDDNDANNNISTTINCLEHSNLNHCILHHAGDGKNISQQSITQIKQAEYSTVNANIFAFGGALSRIELALSLQGAHAKCNASYLAYTIATEVQNVILKVDHCVPHCQSNSLARAVLKDKSSTDFVGRIEVHKDASKSIADLQIKNILCSPKAQATNRPELEIYNDDVHASHGSSTGQISEDALFYMRSRGLDKEQAIAMIIEGFIQPAIESCSIPEIVKLVHEIVKERS